MQRDAAGVRALMPRGRRQRRRRRRHDRAALGRLPRRRRAGAAAARGRRQGQGAATRIGAMTPLFMAARNGHAPIVEAAARRRGQRREANGNGTTVLMTAAGVGQRRGGRRCSSTRRRRQRRGDDQRPDGADVRGGAGPRRGDHGAARAAGPIPNARPRSCRDRHRWAIRYKEEAARQGHARASRSRGRPQRITAMGGMTALHFAAREGPPRGGARPGRGRRQRQPGRGAEETSPMSRPSSTATSTSPSYLLDHGADPKLLGQQRLPARSSRRST